MKLISISEKANSNYLAKVVQLDKLEKHPNADRLQVATIDFQTVITGLDAKVGDIYVYFPVESRINHEFLSCTNSYRDKKLNFNEATAGFFEANRRVKAVRLRGEKSMGYIVSALKMSVFYDVDFSEHIGEEFDTIGDTLLVDKYFVPVRTQGLPKQGKKPRISRMVDGQVHLHVDTENLRRNADMIKPDDDISITYKLHGTSWWVSNIPVKRKLGLVEKGLRLLGTNINEIEYDYVYGSRKVVKNEHETQGTMDFYDGDLWKSIKDDVKDFIPKNFTFYGECVGFTKGGGEIQKDFDYKCKQGEYNLYIYRITFTNADGLVYNLSTKEIAYIASKYGFNMVPVLYSGKAKDWQKAIDVEAEDWTEQFVRGLETLYNEQDCYMCDNKVPQEGIVLRKERADSFEAYKLKSFAFLEYETKMLDSGTQNMEDESEVTVTNP